ncbi:MAG: FAD-dependent oxidoreductase [bacterium]|nr:FAD-dependent oxidoreductase [bacterium]
MKRNLPSMGSNSYDVIVVGGGITGACIARDAALRGLTVALLDKGDFAGATTAASSKLIHGGLRYLQNLEIGLVRESLRERRIWSNVAPHMIDPLSFIMPTTGGRVRDRLTKAIGLTLYDWLAYDRNRLDDPEKSIPAHKKLTREETLELEPGLDSPELTGAMIFYDYQMHSPERLALECILSAAEHGADVANYAEVTGFLREDDCVTGVQVRDSAPDLPDSNEFTIRGRVIVNAAGPWADSLMESVHRQGDEDHDAPSRHLIRSKGIHLITRPLTNGHAVAIPGEGTHFFILPWRGYSLVGTTDTVYKGDPDKVHCSEKDIVDFIATVNTGHPSANLRRSDVVYFYAGLRPLVDTTADHAQDDDPDSYAASRASEIYDHEREDGIAGLVTAIGGKWTTSRNLAENAVDLIVKKLGDGERPCSTEATPTFGGDIGPFADFCRDAVERLAAPARATDAATFPPEVIEHLAKNYGGRVRDVVALVREDPQLAARLSPNFPDIAAQVVYAARREMAVTLEDVVLRRTGLGTTGSPGDGALNRVADLMASEFGWDDSTRTREIGRVVARFGSWARTVAIVNPWSFGRRTGALWPGIHAKLTRAIGPVETVFTDEPMAATRLASQALKDGMEQVIAVGGDGTINEVVNGFFENGEPINEEALLAVLTSGTGGDFRKSFGMPAELDAQIERLARSEIRHVDLGKLTYVDDDGNEAVRYFDNVASFGLGGHVDRTVNRMRFLKRFGGRFAFQWAAVKSLLTYRSQRVRITVDDVFDEVLDTSVGAACNGQYFGSGMHVAPNADPNDGLFDVLIGFDLNRFELLGLIPRIYTGSHLEHKKVISLRGRRLTATPVDSSDEVLLDVDGEAPGRLPATFEILPNALYLRS